jgi:hypothetical protein
VASGSLGSESLILTADASGLARGLNNASQKIKTFNKDAQKQAAEIKAGSREQIGAAFGGESIAAGLAKGGLAGAAIAGLAFAGKELYTAARNVRQFKKDIEAGQDATDKYLHRVEQGFKRAAEAIAEFDDIAGTSPGLTNYSAQINVASNQLDELKINLNNADKERERWDSKWNSVDSFKKWVQGDLEGTEQAADARFQSLRASQKEHANVVNEMKRKQAELLNPLSSPEARKGLRLYIKENEDAAKALSWISKTQGVNSEFGRTAEETQLQALKDKFGFKDGDLAAARAAVLAKNVQEADYWYKELLDDAGLLGNGIKKNAEELKLEEFKNKGIDADRLKQMQQIIDLKKTIDEPYIASAGILKGTGADYSAQYKFQFDQGKMEARDILKQQLEEQKKAGNALNIIAKALTDKPAEIVI